MTVWKNQELSGEVTIRPDGTITMPLIGDVPAAGLTANVLAKRIGDRLTEYLSSPIVTVQVKEVNSYFIYVLGRSREAGEVSAEVLCQRDAGDFAGRRLRTLCEQE